MNASERMPIIEKHGFGSMRIGGRTYYSDISISAGAIARWWREESHLVRPADIDSILATKPAVLVIGTGRNGRMEISDEARKLCGEAGVELAADRTERAIEIYNAIVLEGARSVAAAFHLTC
jgi:hypothetical protein